MAQQTLALIGVGAFGQFMLPHLFKSGQFQRILLCDKAPEKLHHIAAPYNAEVVDITKACSADIIILAVPVPVMGTVAKTIAPHLRAGQLVIEVGSVKVEPLEQLSAILPADVHLVGVHPLFGPQSAANGLAGHNVAVVEARGGQGAKIAKILQELNLNVHECTAAEHDAQMAYVQGLTHMVAKVFTEMNMPELFLTTRTFDLLADAMAMVQDDSEELFKTIQRDNPYVDATKEKFFTAVKNLEKRLKEDAHLKT